EGPARRSPPHRKLELRRLVKGAPAEASDANGHLDVETPSARRGGDHNEGALGAADLRPQHALVESIESRAAPPPAEDRDYARDGGAHPARRRRERDDPREGERGERRDPDQIRKGDPEAERREQRVRWRAES